MAALTDTPRSNLVGDPISGFDNLIEPRNTPLRRAVYNKIADFALSYKINIEKLREENEKLRKSCPIKDENPASISNNDNEKAKKDQIEPDDLSSGQDRESASDSVTPVSPNSIITNDEKRSLPHKGFLQKIIPPNCGFNLCLLVGKVDVVVDKLRVDHSRVRLAEVELGDETGTVSLRARDNQIDLLKEISARSGSVVLRNCTLELYQGKHLRLAVTKWGKLTEYPDHITSTPPAPTTMNRDLNFSKVDLHLVLDLDMESEQKLGRQPNNGSQSTGIQDVQIIAKDHMSQNVGCGQVQQRKYRDKKQNRKGPFSNGRNQNRGYQDNNVNIPINMTNLPPLSPYAHVYTGNGPQFAYHGQSQQPGDPQEQQLLLLQQYELQQRHMEQMQLYSHQQERHVPSYIVQRHGHQMSQAPSNRHPEIRSVDSTDFSVASLGSEFVLSQPGATSHQIDNSRRGVSVGQRLPVRQHFLATTQVVTTSGSADMQNYNSMQSHSPQIHQGFFAEQENLVAVNSTLPISESPSIFVAKVNKPQYVTHPDQKQNLESWNTKQHMTNKNNSGMMKGSISPNQMNPQASSFAPSYGQMMMYPAHQQLHPLTLQYMAPIYPPTSDATSPQPMQMYGSMMPNQTSHSTENEESMINSSQSKNSEVQVTETISSVQEKG